MNTPNNSITDDNKILLVLDLDETLIHATEEKLMWPEDFTFMKYFIYKRPGLEAFLNAAREHFKIGVWSSAGDEYVAWIVDRIKPNDLPLEIIWGRTRCTPKHDLDTDIYYWEKRLDKLKKKGFPLERILIVDDSPEKAKSNFGNAIYIDAFMGNPQDTELAALLHYLLTLKDMTNVRNMEKRSWKNRISET